MVTRLVVDSSPEAVSSASSAARGLEQLLADEHLSTMVERRRVLDAMEEAVRRVLRRASAAASATAAAAATSAPGLRIMLHVLLQAVSCFATWRYNRQSLLQLVQLDVAAG